eukprot:jgi/Bigna1/135848/aug1.31_g10556
MTSVSQLVRALRVIYKQLNAAEMNLASLRARQIDIGNGGGILPGALEGNEENATDAHEIRLKSLSPKGNKSLFEARKSRDATGKAQNIGETSKDMSKVDGFIAK